MKLLISGGGTGGHVFPAIAIADAVKVIQPECQILFVGALGKLEMEKVPEAGYKIIGLPIRGLQRNLSLENLKLGFRLVKSLWMSFKILKNFNPDVVLGVGGYASGPVLRVASWLGKTTMIQEQNSFPGITNRLLSKKAKKIFVAFEGMDRFFDRTKMIHAGNPVRSQFILEATCNQGLSYFNLSSDKLTIGVLGGSLGASAINEAMIRVLDQTKERSDIQWIWQTGKAYFEKINKNSSIDRSNVKLLPFIDRMDLVYAASDVMLTRAGALTLAELALAGKPSLLIPSPNVAEDHQRKNAMAFVEQGAARMIQDADLNEKLWVELVQLIENRDLRISMANKMKQLAKPNAALEIANHILKEKAV